MFTHLKNFICSLFNIKACKCNEDEHIEFYTKVPEPDVPVLVEPCNLHRYFKARCPHCQAAQKGEM